MNYLTAINKVLQHEGGFVNDPKDSGGATNFGITKKVYEAFKRRAVSIDEVKSMPRTDAVAIYKAEYWDKILGDQISSYKVAFAIFDQAVNRGVSAAVKSAQRVLGVQETGVMGPVTLKKINETSEGTFLARFLADAEKFYRDLVASRPKDQKFLNGWLKRVQSIADYVGVKPLAISAGALLLIGVLVIIGISYTKKIA